MKNGNPVVSILLFEKRIAADDEPPFEAGMTELREFSSASPEIFRGSYAVTILHPDGRVIYANATAKLLFGRNVRPDAAIVGVLSSPSDWDSIVEKLAIGKSVADEPVLTQTRHNDTDIAYLTIHPEFDENGAIIELMCLWSSHKERLATSPEKADASTLSQYVHDLEKMIEHRAYQQVLAAEQNEYLSEVAEVLPMGLAVATVEGDVIYRNRAMMEDFGLRASDYGRPNIRYFLSREVCELFREVGKTGLRRWRADRDPSGKPVDVDLLPLLRTGEVQRIVILFSRPAEGGTHS